MDTLTLPTHTELSLLGTANLVPPTWHRQLGTAKFVPPTLCRQLGTANFVPPTMADLYQCATGADQRHGRIAAGAAVGLSDSVVLQQAQLWGSSTAEAVVLDRYNILAPGTQRRW